MIGLNKRQQKKIAKQNILNDIKKKYNVDDKQARTVYKNSEYTKLTSRQLSAKSNLLVKNNNVKNNIFDKTIKTGKDAIPYLNSIISTFKQEVNGFKSTVARWLDNHNLDVEELPTKWFRKPLNELDIKLMEFRKDYGLLDNQNDQFIANYMTASSRTIGLVKSPIDDLNNIIKEVMSTQENNVKDAYDLIVLKFEKLAEEYFHGSKIESQKEALNYSNAYVGYENPIDPKLFEK